MLGVWLLPTYASVIRRKALDNAKRWRYSVNPVAICVAAAIQLPLYSLHIRFPLTDIRFRARDLDMRPGLLVFDPVTQWPGKHLTRGDPACVNMANISIYMEPCPWIGLLASQIFSSGRRIEMRVEEGVANFPVQSEMGQICVL